MTKWSGVPQVPQLGAGHQQYLQVVKQNLEYLKGVVDTNVLNQPATSSSTHQTLSMQNSLVSVTGTTSATTVWTFVVPAYQLTTSNRLRLKASGKYTNNTGVSVNVSLYVGYGGQTVFNGTIAVPTNANSGSWDLNADIGMYLGITNKQESISRWTMFSASSVGGVATGVLSGGDLGAGNNTLTVDSTAMQTMSIVHTLANASALIETHSVVLTAV